MQLGPIGIEDAGKQRGDIFQTAAEERRSGAGHDGFFIRSRVIISENRYASFRIVR
jgi:hypothetical protein